jgi:hypothetical protein
MAEPMTTQQMLDISNRLQADAPPAPMLQSSLFGASGTPIDVPAMPPQMYDHTSSYAGLPLAPDSLPMTTQQMFAQHPSVLDPTAATATGPLPPPGPPGQPGSAPGGPAAPAVLSPEAMAMARQQFNAGTGNGQLAQMAYLKSIENQQTALGNEAAAGNALYDLQAQKGEEMAPIDRERQQAADEHVDRMNQIRQETEKQNAVQQRKVQAAVDAAGASDVHSFWQDKSVPARILGVIAQALSGAANGLSGNPGAPTPLDRIINEDFQRQVQNQENKSKSAGQQQTLYDQMLRATGNRVDAETAWYTANNNRVASMATTLANKFAQPEAIAKAKAFAAQKDRENAQIEERRAATQMSIAMQQGNAGLGAAVNLAGQESAYGAKTAAKGSDSYNALPGMMNGLEKGKTTSAIYNKMQKGAGDLMGYLDTLEHARQTLDEPGGMATFYKFATDHDLSFSMNRSDAMMALGKRLEGSEEGMANRGSVGFLKSYVGQDALKAREHIHSLQLGWARILLNRYRAADPHMAIDVNAPVVGPLFKEIIDEENAQRMKHAAR